MQPLGARRWIGLAALAVVGGSACWRSHGVSESLDAGRPDATGRDAARVDSGERLDAGSCMTDITHTPDHLCIARSPTSPTATIRVREWDDCACAARLVCDARIGESPTGLRTLNVSVRKDGTCDDFCRACTDFVGECALPEGPFWEVRVNGAVVVPVRAEREPLSPDLCATIVAPPPSPLDCGPPGGFDPDAACTPDVVSSDFDTWISASFSTVNCFDVAAGCVAFRDGFDRVRVVPFVRECECHVCGGCEPTLRRITSACDIGPLFPGTVRVEMGPFAAEVFSTDGRPDEIQNDACRDTSDER